MQVVILCGGMGTRLREETEYRPKPLVEIGGRPIIWHIMKICAHYGLNEFILCLGYKGEMIKKYFLSYEAMNNDFTITLGEKTKIAYHGKHAEQEFTITLADTGQENMTGSRLKQVARYIGGESFMVTYGDGLSNVNLAQLLSFHRSHGKLVTITASRPYSRYGVMLLGDNGKVRDFAEKPKLDGWINSGFLVFNQQALEYVSEEPHCSLEMEPFSALTRDNHVMAFQHHDFFHSMDTYRDYLYLNELWRTGVAPWKVWG